MGSRQWCVCPTPTRRRTTRRRSPGSTNAREKRASTFSRPEPSQRARGRRTRGHRLDGDAGIVAITDDGHCVQNHDLMRRAVEYARMFDLPVLDHCQDYSLVGDGVMNEGYWSTVLGLPGWPAAGEELIVLRNIVLAELCGSAIHCQHLSCAGSVRHLREARGRGVRITGEVCPHHIALTDEAVCGYDTHYKMNPPLRTRGGHRRANWWDRGRYDHDPRQRPRAAHRLRKGGGIRPRTIRHPGAGDGVWVIPPPAGRGKKGHRPAAPDRVADDQPGAVAAAQGRAWHAVRPAPVADITLIDPGLEWTVNVEDASCLAFAQHALRRLAAQGSCGANDGCRERPCGNSKQETLVPSACTISRSPGMGVRIYPTA